MRFGLKEEGGAWYLDDHKGTPLWAAENIRFWYALVALFDV